MSKNIRSIAIILASCAILTIGAFVVIPRLQVSHGTPETTQPSPLNSLKGDANRIGEDLTFSLQMIEEEKDPAIATALIHDAINLLRQRTDIRNRIKVLRYRLEAAGPSKESSEVEKLWDILYEQMLENTLQLGKAIDQLDKGTAQRLQEKVMSATQYF